MSPIDIITEAESILCTCDGCGFRESPSGHSAVLQAQSRSAEHAIVTGHTVREHLVTDKRVCPA